ncbi:glycosyltransferase family 2 protein [Sphingobacterium kitahiroshimense]|uniref:Glycosyltransferase n=1 Tax=Sphingobacterium kitahiroshimense TaxID=470446 RepID=A0ABV0C0C8_9SPHI
MNPLISIIIPVFNVADYLPACIESLIHQEYRELEIILINDGSSDNSGAICDRFAQKDTRIKVIHKQNGGLSEARNLGLDKAQGSYISFVDSDDVIDKKFIQTLVSLLLNSEASIALCDYTLFSTKIPQAAPSCSDTFQLYTGHYMLENLYNKKWVPKNVIACNKLYERSVWEELRYPKGLIHEDEFVIHHIYDQVDQVAYSPIPLYYYRQREASITKEISAKRISDIVQLFNIREVYFKDRGYDLLVKENRKAKFLNIAILAVTNRNEILRDLLKQNLSTVLRLPNIPFKMKCSCALIVVFPSLFWKLKNFKQKIG